jgi:excisionase family DNA binding protein
MIEFRIGNLAALLGVHRNTVRNWIKRGQLKAKPTIGKRYSIDEGQLLAFCREAGVPEEKLRMLFSNAESGVLKSSETMETFASEGDMSKQPIGAVMVVGGGVSGIQASLDLADSGYYVYLVEKSAGIGGVMAQLDKTFPTNDCAM